VLDASLTGHTVTATKSEDSLVIADDRGDTTTLPDWFLSQDKGACITSASGTKYDTQKILDTFYGTPGHIEFAKGWFDNPASADAVLNSVLPPGDPWQSYTGWGSGWIAYDIAQIGASPTTYDWTPAGEPMARLSVGSGSTILNGYYWAKPGHAINDDPYVAITSIETRPVGSADPYMRVYDNPMAWV
jgi:hypothetical protein